MVKYSMVELLLLVQISLDYIMMADEASFYWVKFSYNELYDANSFDKTVHYGKQVF